MNRPSADDPRVIEALKSSVVLSAVTALSGTVWRAAARSRTASVAATLRMQWDTAGIAGRRRIGGITLIVAALTNFTLSLSTDHPAGWLWMVPPAAAASVGVLLAWSCRDAGHD